MAGGAAKKAAKAKAAAASTYLPMLICVNLWYVAVRLYYLGGTRSHYVKLGGCLLTYVVTYSTAIDAAATPDSLASYFFDVMALTAATQGLGAFSDRAWYILCVVPAFALYKAIAWKFGGPSKPNPAAEPEPAEGDASAGKKEKKTKRKVMKGGPGGR